MFSWIDSKSAESGSVALPPGTSGWPLASRPSPLPAQAASKAMPSAMPLRDRAVKYREIIARPLGNGDRVGGGSHRATLARQTAGGGTDNFHDGPKNRPVWLSIS